MRDSLRAGALAWLRGEKVALLLEAERWGRMQVNATRIARAKWEMVGYLTTCIKRAEREERDDEQTTVTAGTGGESTADGV